MTDALLFLHVLSAFLLVSTVVMFSAVALGVATPLPGPTALVARRAWDVGGLGTLVFGIWLALRIDGYGLLDLWIIAAIVLWAVAAELSRRAEAAAEEGGGSSQFTQLHWLRTAVVVLLLADMIFKPGA